MADKKCGLRYCAATVYDWNEVVNVIKCPCMKCLGEKCEACDMFKQSEKLQMNLQYQMCSKCKFFNGR